MDSIDIRHGDPASMVCENKMPYAEPPRHLSLSPEADNESEKGHGGESVGEDNASAVGCAANHGIGSVRSAFCSYALSNGNGYFAGAFAITNGENYFGDNFTTRPSRSNNPDNSAAIGGQGQCDYGSVPFMDAESAESNATATVTGSGIFTELKIANSKRKLKHLKKFFVNEEIVRAGVERAFKRASNSPELRKAKANKEAIIKRIIYEMETETYHVGPIEPRMIPPKSKDGKWRKADIYTIYDRCMLNVMLIVTQRKLNNLLTRNVYSGVHTRSLFSNTKKYCMVNKVRHYVKSHPDDAVELTDIRHFYENLHSDVALGVLFKTIVCPFTRRLFAEVLLALDHVAIGGTLSQTVAMVTMSEMDREILNRYHPHFYGVFGDNRIIGADKATALMALHYETSYLAGRYGLPLKGDYQLHMVKNGFRFCKYDYFRDTVHPRAELRRRAIRAAKRGKRYYAGYKGIFEKTDCGSLRYLIENDMEQMTTRNGMTIKPMKGEIVNNKDTLVGERLIVLDYRRVDNGKDSGYFFRIQALHMGADAPRLIIFKDGSYEMKDFFRCVEEGMEELPYDDILCREGNSYYFKRHHVSNKDACEAIIENLRMKGINV